MALIPEEVYRINHIIIITKFLILSNKILKIKRIGKASGSESFENFVEVALALDFGSFVHDPYNRFNKKIWHIWMLETTLFIKIDLKIPNAADLIKFNLIILCLSFYILLAISNIKNVLEIQHQKQTNDLWIYGFEICFFIFFHFS